MRPAALLFLLALTGCATSAPRSAAPALSVPFIAQAPNLCGPAALAMLATYHGHPVTQDAIAQDIYLPTIRGTLTVELAEYARRYGLWTRQYRGSRADLRAKLAAGLPLIVLGKIGASYHYFVVLADERDHLIVHSGTQAHQRVDAETFTRWWNRANQWTLLVCPPAQARWSLSAAEHNDLGVFLEETGQLDTAAAQYQAAIAREPAQSDYHFNLGNVRLHQQNLPAAVDAFARAIAADPENADALNNLAWTYHEMGDHLDRAALLCQRAIQLRPAQRAYYLDTLGSVLLKQGRPAEARAAFTAAHAATTDRQTGLRAAIAAKLDRLTPP